MNNRRQNMLFTPQPIQIDVLTGSRGAMQYTGYRTMNLIVPNTIRDETTVLLLSTWREWIFSRRFIVNHPPPINISTSAGRCHHFENFLHENISRRRGRGWARNDTLQLKFEFSTLTFKQSRKFPPRMTWYSRRLAWDKSPA